MITTIIDEHDLSTAEQEILALDDEGQEGGEDPPGHGRLVQRLGLGYRTVRLGLWRLEQLGLVRRERG